MKVVKHTCEIDRNGWHHFFELGRLSLAISQKPVWGLGFGRGWRAHGDGPMSYFWSLSGRWFSFWIVGRQTESRDHMPFWIF